MIVSRGSTVCDPLSDHPPAAKPGSVEMSPPIH